MDISVMKRDNDWIDSMRSSLRDAEIPPPEGGWARLEGDLAAGALPKRGLRRYLPRIAAAAAAVLIGFVAGGLLLRNPHNVDIKGNVIASKADGGVQAVVENTATQPDKELSDRVGEVYRRSLGEQSVAVAQAVVSERARDNSPLHIAGEAPEGAATVSAAETQAVPASEPTVGSSAAQSEADSSDPKTRSGAVSRAKTAAPTYYEDLFREDAPRKSRTSLGVYAGGAFGSSGAKAGGAPNGLMSDMSPSEGGYVHVQKTSYENASFRHKLPLSFGLTARKEFAHGLSLESGVVYSLVMSDVKMTYASESVSQKLHFVGVPLRLNWNFLQRDGFSLYLGAGGMVETCVGARLGGKKYDEPGVQWSIQGVVGAQYQLGNHVGLYFEPEMSYYFNGTQLQTARTEAPLSLTLRLGLRFSF